MYAIVSKIYGTPICSRGKGIQVVVWSTKESATAFLREHGEDTEQNTIIEMDRDGIRRIASIMACREEDIVMVPGEK